MYTPKLTLVLGPSIQTLKKKKKGLPHSTDRPKSAKEMLPLETHTDKITATFLLLYSNNFKRPDVLQILKETTHNQFSEAILWSKTSTSSETGRR